MVLNPTNILDPASTSMNPTDFYERFITEAPLILGDTGEPINPATITWYNPELFKEGQDFIANNYFSHCFALSGALIFGTTFKRVTTVLLRTGNFSTPSKAFIRHIETQVYVEKWATENIMEPASKGFQDLQHVRKLHLHALRRCQKYPLNLNVDGIKDRNEQEIFLAALQKDLEPCLDKSQIPQDLLTYSPTVFFSQFDLAMVIYGMYAMILLFPKLLGVSDLRGVDGLIHFWALVGRMLGIQDRFNPALCPDRDLHLKILRNLVLPGLKDMDVTMLDLSDIYVTSLGKVGVRTSVKVLFYAGLSSSDDILPGFKGENMFKILSWGDWVQVRLIQATIWSIYYFPFVRSCANQVFRVMAWMSFRKMERDQGNM